MKPPTTPNTCTFIHGLVYRRILADVQWVILFFHTSRSVCCLQLRDLWFIMYRLLYSLIIYEIVNFSFFTLYSLLLLSFYI